MEVRVYWHILGALPWGRGPDYLYNKEGILSRSSWWLLFHLLSVYLLYYGGFLD